MLVICARYNPYLQARHGIEHLKQLGRDVDKVDLLWWVECLWLFQKNRDYFIWNLHDTLSGHTSNNIYEAVKYSEGGIIKCIGSYYCNQTWLVHETAVKWHVDLWLWEARDWSAEYLWRCGQRYQRGPHGKAICELFHLAKDSSFKAVAHMMPDQPSVGTERDIEQFAECFENSAFHPDG